jgi:hypothetical protein
MKNLTSPSFMRTFDLIIGLGNPGLKATHWNHDGVGWSRHRYSVSSEGHGFVIEIVMASRPGRGGWSLMMTREHWWVGDETKAVKSVRWARPVHGRRNDIIDWFRQHELAIDRSSRSPTREAAAGAIAARTDAT